MNLNKWHDSVLFFLLAIHVLDSMLLLDPESRVTAAEGLALPYFSEFREPEEETEAPPYDHSLDEAEQSVDQWKRTTGEWGPHIENISEIWVRHVVETFKQANRSFYREQKSQKRYCVLICIYLLFNLSLSLLCF